MRRTHFLSHGQLDRLQIVRTTTAPLQESYPTRQPLRRPRDCDCIETHTSTKRDASGKSGFGRQLDFFGWLMQRIRMHPCRQVYERRRKKHNYGMEWPHCKSRGKLRRVVFFATSVRLTLVKKVIAGSFKRYAVVARWRHLHAQSLSPGLPSPPRNVSVARRATACRALRADRALTQLVR